MTTPNPQAQINRLREALEGVVSHMDSDFEDPGFEIYGSVSSHGGNALNTALNEARATLADVTAEGTRDDRQNKTADWCAAAFGADTTSSIPQRGVRMLEESIEAYQACGCDPAMAHKLVDYVFARPVGNLQQELGGVGITVLALAQAAGFSADGAEAAELIRVTAKPLEHFRDRNKAKDDAGFKAMPAPPEAVTPTDRNWDEDAVHENGNYHHTCVSCRQSFTGHKRRVTCRPCAISAEGTWPVHPFVAVGGEFPDTCKLCACFRHSANHAAEAVTTDGEKLLDIVHCDKCGRQRASNASHFNACPYCSFGNILAEAEIPCPNAGDPSYGVDYRSGHGHICELCRVTGTVLSPTAEAVETRKEWQVVTCEGWQGTFGSRESAQRFVDIRDPHVSNERFIESRTITATPWKREEEAKELANR